MKKQTLIITMFAILRLSNLANAQTIPNGDFENWELLDLYGWCPAGWSGFQIYGDNDCQSGKNSVRFLTNQNYPFCFLSFVNNNYISTDTISKFLNGYIKTNTISPDTIYAGVAYTDGTHYAEGYDITQVARYTWTPFHISISNPPDFKPDSFYISFLIKGPSTSYNHVVYLDNISLSNTPIGNELGTRLYSGLENFSDHSNTNYLIYPNPATQNVTIETTNDAIIEIKNMHGQLVKLISSGNDKTIVDISDFPHGLYFVVINTNTGVIVKKLMKE